MHPNQQNLTSLGIRHLKEGKLDDALGAFERLNSPVPSIAALNWAAILTHRRNFGEALQVLSKVNLKVNKEIEDNIDNIMDIVACTVFDDILSVISERSSIGSWKFGKKKRLLKATSFAMSPFLKLLDTLGQLASKFGSLDGRTIQSLYNGFLEQCWIFGLPVKRDFISNHIYLEHMEGFKCSKNVYREIFLSYIDYWMFSREDIRDFLIASVKPADVHALYSMVREKKPSVILEIGTYVGFSTCIMAQAIKDNGQGNIYCVDPNIKHLSIEKPLLHTKNMLKNMKLDNYVNIYEGFFSHPKEIVDPEVAVLGTNAYEFLPPVDFAFIDGDHSTTAVLQDFMMVLPCLAKDATILIHDTNSSHSVRQGIQILLKDDILKNKIKYLEFIPSGINGLGVIEYCR